MRIEKRIPINVIFNCPAPHPSPVDIIKNKYTNSSGSFIAALNLTIESAPTSPSERARDDLTMVITNVVVKPRIIKFFEKSNLFDSDVENFKYVICITKLRTPASNNPSMNVIRLT